MSENKSGAVSVVAEPKVLLPCCDMQKWAVVACDQFTSDKEYWQKLDEFVGDSPSALRLILPECYIGDGEAQRRKAVCENMKKYYADGLFRSVSSFVAVRRTFQSGGVRKGLIAAVDLEQYDYRPESKALIRATEGTVADRLPPRVKIREQSLLELPHIMLLIDDPKNVVFSAVEKAVGETLYDFDLCMGGGHIEGRAVNSTVSVQNAFDELLRDMTRRYGERVLMLVGDGNHSLAAAKNCYEKAKAAGDETADIKRYALCEIVNLYDDGIRFEPIHRVVTGVSPEDLAARLSAGTQLGGELTLKGAGRTYKMPAPADTIEAVAYVQTIVEEYTARYGGSIDYIHGSDELDRLARADDCLTVAFEPLNKKGFTEYIIKNGILPKKTFSIGHACEKRYYLEARIIGKID